MRYNKELFIKKANELFSNKYDYSQVEYVNQSTPVKIVCPLHGVFERKPSYHLQGGDCPVCAKQRMIESARKPMSPEAKEKRRQTNLRKYGATTFAGSKQAQELRNKGKGPWSKKARKKAAKTCMDRFGAKTWAESDIGIATAKANCASPEVRKRMSEIAKSDLTRQHYAETSRKNCGANHWTQTDAGKHRLHEMFSTEEERKARSDRMLSEEVKAKIQATSMERYGVPYYWQSDDARKRLRKLLQQDEVQQKIIATKKLRGTINSSKPEKIAYALLVEKFDEDDVEPQYIGDERYPFACDFYIKSLDYFIELNLSWLHGFHWFDSNDENDIKRLKKLESKASDKKPMYERAIYIWTYDDLCKKHIAEQNNLKYFVFWKNDLSDFKDWLITL